MVTGRRDTEQAHAYAKRAQDLLHAQDSLSLAQTRAVLRVLVDARREVTDALVTLSQHGNPGTFESYQVGELRRTVDLVAVVLDSSLETQLHAAVDQSWLDGAAFTPALVSSVAWDTLPPPVPLFVQGPDTEPLTLAKQLATELAWALSQDFRTRARKEVTLGVVGVKSPQQVIAKVADLLRTQPDRLTGEYGPIPAQAERIVRTETMAAFNRANMAQQSVLSRKVPGMQKYWLSMSDDRARPAHLDAYLRYQPGGKPGPIPVESLFLVGGQTCQGPHDPSLSVGNVANCRCVSVPWKTEWFQEAGV